MQTVASNYRSLSVIWEMHCDKVMMSAAIVLGLLISVGVSTMAATGF